MTAAAIHRPVCRTGIALISSGRTVVVGSGETEALVTGR